MKNNSNSEKGNYIGKWSASMKTGRKAILVVHGLIPTKGEKESFSLRVADQHGIDPFILVLELKPDLAALDGSGEVEVYYSEVIDRYDQYKSILVKGAGRELAFFDVG